MIYLVVNFPIGKSINAFVVSHTELMRWIYWLSTLLLYTPTTTPLCICFTISVLDCQVSEWGPWGDCDVTCGTGIMARNRTVLQMAQNGGKHCPSLAQKRGCQGYKCHHHRDRRILKEAALLLPASLSGSRRENDTIDIRRNLRLRYRDAFKHNRNNE